MNGIYIVCENKVYNYIPEPKDLLLEPKSIFNTGRFPESILEPNSNLLELPPLRPRFDPIIAPISEPNIKTKPNNIVCLCKDMDTAKHFLNGFPNRYILGPYNVV